MTANSLKDLLDSVYDHGESDNWAGELTSGEADKVHETCRHVVTELTTVLCAQHASEADKAWARKRIDALLDFATDKD